MKSKRTKACEISLKTKERVYQRDGGLCIKCHRPGIPNAHYIRRSQRRFRNRTECSYFMHEMP